MAAVALPHAAVSFATRQSLQVEALRASGFVVRNTFIDAETPSEGSGSRRRALSTPASASPQGVEAAATERSSRRAPSRRSRKSFVDDDDDCMSPSPSVSGRSSSSTAIPENDSFALTSDMGDSEVDSLATPHCEGRDAVEAFAVALPDLVQRECAFLRIAGHSLVPLQGQRKHGATACLRIFVLGLPFMRRAKWQHPLLYSVAAVLQRCGCPAAVRGGELYAPLEGSTGDIVRVDFAAARQ